MKNKFTHKVILILLILPPMLLFSGCGLVAMLAKTEDLRSLDLTIAHRDRNETTKSISIGMTKSEVIEAWGNGYIYKLDEQDKIKLAKLKAEGKLIVDRYDADEFWVYSHPTEEPPLFGKEFSYEIYFKGDKVIKIIEQEWTHRLIGPGDL